MATILETERLLLREFVEDDAEAFFAFDGDPEVARYTGEEPATSVEQVRQRIVAYPDYRVHGFGRWAVVTKLDDRVIGFCGLKYLSELDEIDLGYRLRADCWGQGFATEASLAVVRHGFERLGLDRIIALVLPGNAASIRVLEKIGMQCDGVVEYFGQQAQRWVLEKPGR